MSHERPPRMVFISQGDHHGLSAFQIRINGERKDTIRAGKLSGRLGGTAKWVIMGPEILLHGGVPACISVERVWRHLWPGGRLGTAALPLSPILYHYEYSRLPLKPIPPTTHTPSDSIHFFNYQRGMQGKRAKNP